MDEERLTLTQLKALRVADLKAKLAELGLPQSGLKADLVERLNSYYDQIDNQNDDQEEVVAEDEDEEQEEVDDGQEEVDDDQEGEYEDDQDGVEEIEEEDDSSGEADRMAEAEEAKRLAEIEEAQRLAEAKRLAEAEEAKKLAEAAELARQNELAIEAERQQRQLEAEAAEAKRLAAIREAERLAEAQRVAEAKKLAEAEKARKFAEEARRNELAMEAERQRQLEAEAAAMQEQEVGGDDDAEEEVDEIMEEPENVPKKSLFKAQIAPPSQIASMMPGPPPGADELESTSPRKPVPLMSLTVEPPAPSSENKEAPPPSNQDLRLPRALEEALAFKSEWASQVGVSPGDIARVEREGVPQHQLVQAHAHLQQHQQQQQDTKKSHQKQPVQLVEGMDDDEKSKGKKKNKKKKKKKNRPEEWARQAAEAEKRRQEAVEDAARNETEPDVEVEYIQEKLDLDMTDPMHRQFSRIFEAFKIKDEDDEKKKGDTNLPDYGIHNEELKKVPKEMLEDDDDMIEEKEDEDDDKQKLSKRKQKILSRLSVAELKQLVIRPDVVEMHDVTAKDPGLLVHLKSIRNTVPVPRHWCFKRKYLQGKRGIEKPPFDLPEFIKKTGIMEMREALQEKEQEKSLKSKMREKVRPKLGKIDIDYQKLHDAFFKWQTKPRMTYHGDLYYEGKEFEIRLKEKKPGDLTDDLRTALGMPVGPNAHKVPPPWLISMQRYGPPPSYPNLKIPGLNAAIPEGCSFGYHAGGWGKPPVDETGKPLYGDVFGTQDAGYSQQIPVEEVDQSLWGEMESESEEEESEEEEEEEEETEEAPDPSGMQTPIIDAGLATPSGMSSVGAPGQETPELIELRKRRIEADMEGGDTPSLYTVLPEKKAHGVGASMMGSTHTYEVPPPGGARRIDPGGVEMALNPDEVDLMDTEAMQAKAEAALREQAASLAKEDFSDMVAEHAAKQSMKRKRTANKEETKGGKRHKEFKF